MSLQQELDVSQISEIKAIEARFMGKFFHDFDNVFCYCQIYQEVYNDISSRSVINNWVSNNEKESEIFLQSAMLEKFPKAYVSFVATMNTEWISKASANLQETVYKFLRFFKADLLQVFLSPSSFISCLSNKQLCLNYDNSAPPIL